MSSADSTASLPIAEYQVRVTDEAEQSIRTIYIWIASRSENGAATWYRSLQAALASLRRDPHRCSLAPEARHFENPLRDKAFRMKSGRVYRILFTIRDSEIRILFVRGPGQDWVSP